MIVLKYEGKCGMFHSEPHVSAQKVSDCGTFQFQMGVDAQLEVGFLFGKTLM